MNQSRREVLGVCGAALTALAGCSALDLGDDDPTYDAGRLRSLGEKGIPRAPTDFPVSVPDSMVGRHRERTRTLLQRVPEQPSVPNQAVGRQLQEDREAIRRRLERDGEREDAPAYDPLARLGDARRLRGDAAAVDAAYRAATDDLNPETVTERRFQLRLDLQQFERGWTYRGDDPAAAVVVHRRLETLRREVRRGLFPERLVPAEPKTDVFAVGEAVRRIEVGRAALQDASGLRARYRDGLSKQREFWTAFSVATNQLRRRSTALRRNLHEFIRRPSQNPPFERSVDGTPLERIYRDAVSEVFHTRDDARRARHRGARADAVVTQGLTLASLRTLDAVVAAIEDRQVSVPSSVDEIAAARQAAADALDAAWSATPTALASVIARPAHALFERGVDRLGGRDSRAGSPSTTDGQAAFVHFFHAARYAEAVPQTVADGRAALQAATA